MAARIGFGRGATIRAGAWTTSRYTLPRSFHRGAVWLAAAASFLGILLVIGAR